MKGKLSVPWLSGGVLLRVCASVVALLLCCVLYSGDLSFLQSHRYRGVYPVPTFLFDGVILTDEEVFLESFWQWQRSVVHQARTRDTLNCIPRALVWRPFAGLGNRLQQYTRAVNYAALTNRVFVVDWTHPGSFDRFFRPPVTPFTLQEIGPLLCHNPTHTLKHNSLSIDLASSKRLLDMLKFYGDKVLHPILFVEASGTMLMPLKAVLQYEQRRGKEMNQGPMLRLLVQPSKWVLGVMQPVLLRMESSFTVGVQIRSEYLHFGQDQLFFQCFQEIAGNSELTLGRQTLMFLTTDSEEVAQNFHSILGDRLLYVDKRIVHLDSTSWWSEDLSSMDGTVADFFLLSRSQILLSTHGSSFGDEAGTLGTARNPTMRRYHIGNFNCWHTESECEKFVLPEVCPHARDKLQKDWKSFSKFGVDFKPTWLENGQTRRPVVSAEA